MAGGELKVSLLPVDNVHPEHGRCKRRAHSGDAIRSPVRERRDADVASFSLSSRSGLQTEIVIFFVLEPDSFGRIAGWIG